jgi:hypothetical protein
VTSAQPPGYPPWTYLYQQQENPVRESLLQAIDANQAGLIAVRNTPFRRSIDAELLLAGEMTGLGFMHSVTNRKFQPLFTKGLNFEVDFYHPELKIAVEVEKGEINNLWKNLCKFAESPVIRHGVLVVPVVRQGRVTSSEFYQNTLKRLNHIENILTFLDSLLVIGY